MTIYRNNGILLRKDGTIPRGANPDCCRCEGGDCPDCFGGCSSSALLFTDTTVTWGGFAGGAQCSDPSNMNGAIVYTAQEGDRRCPPIGQGITLGSITGCGFPTSGARTRLGMNWFTRRCTDSSCRIVPTVYFSVAWGYSSIPGVSQYEGILVYYDAGVLAGVTPTARAYWPIHTGCAVSATITLPAIPGTFDVNDPDSILPWRFQEPIPPASESVRIRSDVIDWESMTASIGIT